MARSSLPSWLFYALIPVVMLVGFAIFFVCRCAKTEHFVDDSAFPLVLYSSTNYTGEKKQISSNLDLANIRMFTVKSFRIQPGVTLIVNHTCGGETNRTQYTNVEYKTSVPDYKLCGWSGIVARPTTFKMKIAPQLLAKYSGAGCTYGDSYGEQSDNVMWIDKGCRGSFKYNGITKTCESWGNSRNTCTFE